MTNKNNPTKLPVLDLEKKKMGERELPLQFQEEYRPDLIQRAVLALKSASRQPYGAYPEAGQRHSSEVSKRRRDYRGCYGFGISRVNRKILSRRGTRMFWVGAMTPQTVGGRIAHPPKATKQFTENINKKENRKALRSAMAATLDRRLVQEHGHILPENYPFIIDAALESLQKTEELKKVFLALGFADELTRTAFRKVRAGQGKKRGRKYRRKKGLLVVVSGDCPLLKAARNLPGVEAVEAKALNTQLLAPGARPGRVTLWTTKALETLEKNKLFM